MIKKIVVFVLLVLLVGTAAAFAGGQEEAVEALEIDEFSWDMYEGRTLNVLLRHGGHTTAIDEHLLPYFEEETGVDVNVTWMGRDGWVERLYSMMIDGTPDFDVIVVHDTDIVFLADGGFLEPLDPYLADNLRTPEEADLELVPESIRAGMTVGGNLYAVPTFGNPYIQYYRRDVYDQLGLEPAETWNQYLENSRAVKRAAEAGEVDVSYGHILQGRDGQHLWEEFLARAWPRGGGIVDLEAEEIILTNDANREALQQLITEVEEGLVYPEWSVTTFAEFPDQFSGDGAAAGIASGAAAGFLAEDMADRLDIVGSAPIPGIEQADGSVHRVSPMSGGGLVINAASPNKDVAWHLMAYQLSNPELIERQAGVVTVPVPQAYEGDDAAERIRFDAPAVAAAFPDASPYEPVPGMAEAMHELATQLADVLAGRATVEEGLRRAAEAAERHIDF